MRKCEYICWGGKVRPSRSTGAARIRVASKDEHTAVALNNRLGTARWQDGNCQHNHERKLSERDHGTPPESRIKQLTMDGAERVAARTR